MNIRTFADIKSFFLDNKTLKQTIFKNTFWLAVAEGISRLLEFVLIIYITRILGATEFGKFTFALAFVSMFVILSDFGLSDITTRELSRDKESEKEYSAILSLKIFLSIGTLILMLIASFFITPDPVIQKVIWILAIFILINNFFLIIYAFLRARQRMEYEAGAKILQALILVGIGFFILFKFPSIENISYGYLFANLMALIFILTFFHFRVSSLNLNWDKNIWQKFFRFSWPLGLAYVFSAVFVNVDSVIMGSWGQFTEAGWYNAVHRIVGLTTLPAMLIFTSFYPVLSKLLKESKEKLQKVWNYYLESMIILATPIAVGGLVLAPKIVYSFFGQSFGPSILAFQILIFMAGINFLYNPYILILIVSNQQKKYLWVSLIAAVTNTILNLILIPYYSLYGAAFVALFTALLIFFLLVKASSQLVSITPFNVRNFLIFLISISASLLMYFLISNPKIYALNVFLLILIGIGTYFFFFLILKKIVSQFFKILL